MTIKNPLALSFVLAAVVSAAPALAQAPASAAQPTSPKAPRPAATAAHPEFVAAARAAAAAAAAEAQAADAVSAAHGAMTGSFHASVADAVDRAQAASLAALHVDDLDFDFAFQERRSEEERARAAREREQSREARMYDEAMRQVYESRWERAIARFDDVLTLKGTRVDAALYWKAYAQDRQGQRAEALTTLATLTRDHASSRYLQQARALEAEVRRNAGQPVRPQDQADEDLKLMAIAALQNSAPEQAIPMLEKLLAGTASPKLKERALFVLAQSNSPRAREVLKGIAKGNSTPELQSRAITYLGMHGGAESRAVLAEIYSSTAEVDSKKRIIRALAMGGERARVLAVAQSEKDAELRAEAGGEVLEDAADLDVAGVHALPAGHLEEVEHRLAVAEAVPEHRDRAEVERAGAQPHEVGHDAVELAEEHPHPGRLLGHLE